MSAEIIQFVPRARHGRGPGPIASVAYFPRRPCDLAMGHADTAPCEYAPVREEQCGDDQPA